MKANHKNRILFFCLFFLSVTLFSSCKKKNTIDFSTMTEEEIIAYGRKIGAITVDELNKQLEAVFLDNNITQKHLRDKHNMPQITTDNFSITGSDNFSTIKNFGKKKVIICDPTSEIPKGIYILTPVKALKNIAVNNGYYVEKLDSPLCGYDPGQIGKSVRGYEGSSSAGGWSMKSVVHRVDADIFGNRYAYSFYPQSPDKLVWNFSFQKLN